MAGTAEVFVGIDVGKHHVDVVIGSEGQAARFTNDDEGVERILALVAGLPIGRIVLEASGGYERQITAALLAAGLPAVAINPRQARHFAKALGRLEKTDEVDARVLALFAERIRPPIRALADEGLQKVQDWIARRRQLVDMLVAEKNRVQQARTREIRRDIEAHITWLKSRLRDSDRDLSALLASCPAWDARVELLDAQKGIGRIGATTLVASLPELGTLNRRQIAKLVGIAPLNQDSGTSQGRRAICGGRPEVRSCLYMLTLVATRHHPAIRTFYLRLLSRGKTKKVALVASMRKFLTILNAITRNHLQAMVPASG